MLTDRDHRILSHAGTAFLIGLAAAVLFCASLAGLTLWDMTTSTHVSTPAGNYSQYQPLPAFPGPAVDNNGTGWYILATPPGGTQELLWASDQTALKIMESRLAKGSTFKVVPGDQEVGP
jgi:hypothetical protein